MTTHLIRIGILLLLPFAFAEAKPHSFADAKKWEKIFDDPKRDEWQKPEQVVQELRLKKDGKVAEIGAGTGYFIPHLSRAVPQGKVYATDIEKSLIDHMRSRFESAKLANAIPVIAPTDSTGIPEKVDLVLIVDTYHHIGNREQYFYEMKSVLHPHSEVAIIDFKLESKLGPKKHHKLSAEKVLEEMERAGYVLDRRPQFLPEQYFLIFKQKAKSSP